jgi:hypothetical protein
LLSSIDYKITLAQWIEQAKKEIPTLSEKEAEIYFITYKALLEEVENPGQSVVSSTSSLKIEESKEAQGGKKIVLESEVDVRCFALFMSI